MSARTLPGSLVSVDGVNDAALLDFARAQQAVLARTRRGGISRWGASGVFEELTIADEAAGRPSARTLLLLYAADLAFRLRWEIRPKLAEGRTVVAAPYVKTAVAFGRVAGLSSDWLSSLFRFAPRPARGHLVDSTAAPRLARDGFVEFAWRSTVVRDRVKRKELLERSAKLLRGGAGRHRSGRLLLRKDDREARRRARKRFAGNGRRGLLVAFEGPDGSGKTTQRKLFKTWLEAQGCPVVTTKWNSSDLVKPIIGARKAVRALSAEEFSLLHAADFRHRVEHVILPALWTGNLVIADRFLFTGLARDCARGLDLDWVLNLYQPLLWPDVVFYFSVSPGTSGRRVTATRTPNFYEAGLDVTDLDDPVQSYYRFIERVIREYESLALIFNFIKIDAERSIGEQHHRLRELFREGQRRPWSKWNTDAVAEWLSDGGDAR